MLAHFTVPEEQAPVAGTSTLREVRVYPATGKCCTATQVSKSKSWLLFSSTMGLFLFGSPFQSMGTMPNCRSRLWCEPMPKTTEQAHERPCHSHHTEIHGMDSRTCSWLCPMAPRSPGVCTQTTKQSLWSLPQWRWCSMAHLSSLGRVRDHLTCDSSPRMHTW